MKYCEEYAALLDGFADGELPAEEMERVRAHLETCPGCRAYVDDIFAIRAGFPDAEDAEVPESFIEGVMERVRADAKGKIVEMKRTHFRRWAGTLAALAACCALVVVLRSRPVGTDTASMVLSGGAAEDTTVTATTGAGGPEVYGMTEGAEENEIETQMAPEEPMEAERAVTENGTAESRMAAMDKEDKAFADKKQTATDADSAELPVPAAAPALEDLEEVDAGILLCLSAEEAGDLLEGFDPVWETEAERAYELSGGEYKALLEALYHRESEMLPETVLVVVKAPPSAE